MSGAKAGGPAFPLHPDVSLKDEGWHGMSLLDYFAGQALAGIHARDCFDEGLATPEQRAGIAYIDAMAMLEARAAIAKAAL